MSIKFDKIVEMIHWLDLPKVDEKRGHIEARCPFCGDSRTKPRARRFHIDPYKGTYIYKCFRCGESGNVISLYAYLSNCSYREAKNYLSDKKYDPDNIKNRLSNKASEVPQSENIKIDGDLDIDIQKDCFSLDDVPNSRIARNSIKKLINFKENRKIPDDLPIYFAHSGRYKSRIIIPIYINNRLVYFQGRSIYNDIEPKYLNPKVEKNKIILNIDNFDPEKYIVICEGIIDAHMVGKQGTCVIGGYIDLNFINIVEKYTNKGVIICLDNPKKDNNSYNVLKKLVFQNINKYKKNLKFFIMPSNYDAKDLNDLVKDYEIENVYDFVVKNSKSILYMKQFLVK